MFGVYVNLWVVVAATIAYFVIGALWYSLLFAKPWMKLSKVTKEDASKNGNVIPYIATYLLLYILCYVLANILVYAGSSTIWEGLVTGVWVWLGFIATTMFIDALYAGRPHKLTAINAGYHLTGTLAAAVILTLWA